jgi:hypothetical protein
MDDPALVKYLVDMDIGYKPKSGGSHDITDWLQEGCANRP